MFKGLHIKEPECENCPLSWEVWYEAGDCDCGCMVYKELFQSGIVCWLPNCIKKLIANYKKKKNDEAEAHAYDGFGEWYEEERRKDVAFLMALEERVFRNPYDTKLFLCSEGYDGQLYKHEMDLETASMARMRYEELLESTEVQS